MSWISPLEMNMSISRSIYEGESSYRLLATAQKIAIYSVIPLALIVMVESILKNLLFINLANLVIAILNVGHDLYLGKNLLENYARLRD